MIYTGLELWAVCWIARHGDPWTSAEVEHPALLTDRTYVLVPEGGVLKGFVHLESEVPGVRLPEGASPKDVRRARERAFDEWAASVRLLAGCPDDAVCVVIRPA